MFETPTEPIKWKTEKVIDSHVHFRKKEYSENFKEIVRLCGYDKVNILGGRGAEAIWPKEEMNGKAYQFSMIDYDPKKIEARDGDYQAPQVDAYMENGYDGMKMMDAKPHMRNTWMPLDIDDDYFKPYWEKVEALGCPITLHSSDPIDFWDKGREYENMPPQEHYFQQTITVLERYPKLNMNLAHFFFMGPQLDRLGELFARFPKLHVDLSMAVEYMYYLSDDPVKSREFFVQWAERILYGTDISCNNAINHGVAKAEMLRRFLETDKTIENIVMQAMGREPTPGSNGRLEFQGLDLPQDVLEKVMWQNFERFAGEVPKPINVVLSANA